MMGAIICGSCIVLPPCKRAHSQQSTEASGALRHHGEPRASMAALHTVGSAAFLAALSWTVLPRSCTTAAPTRWALKCNREVSAPVPLHGCRSLRAPEATEPGDGFGMYNSAEPQDPVSGSERCVPTHNIATQTQTLDEEEAIQCILFIPKVNRQQPLSWRDQSEIKY